MAVADSCRRSVTRRLLSLELRWPLPRGRCSSQPVSSHDHFHDFSVFFLFALKLFTFSADDNVLGLLNKLKNSGILSMLNKAVS